MNKNSKIASLVLTASCVVSLTSCGYIDNKLNSLADDAAQKFNGMAAEIHTEESAKASIKFYKQMELDFIGFKLKHGIDTPLERFHQQTAGSLSKIESEFKVHPEYGNFESFMKKLSE